MLSRLCWSIPYSNKRGQNIPLIHKSVPPISATAIRREKEFKMCWVAMLPIPTALNQKWIFCFQENLVKV